MMKMTNPVNASLKKNNSPEVKSWRGAETEIVFRAQVDYIDESNRSGDSPLHIQLKARLLVTFGKTFTLHNVKPIRDFFVLL